MIDYAELLREAAHEIKRPQSQYGRDLIDRLLDAADELEQAEKQNGVSNDN